MMFQFDEDIVPSTYVIPQKKRLSPRFQCEQKKNRSNGTSVARSLPERASIVPTTKRRNRSTSSKSSVQHPSYALLERFSESRYEVFRSRCLDG